MSDIEKLKAWIQEVIQELDEDIVTAEASSFPQDAERMDAQKTAYERVLRKIKDLPSE